MLTGRFFPIAGWRGSGAFGELDRMRRQLDRMMDSFTSALPRPESSGVFPAINITEDDSRLILRAELPGVKSEDLNIQATARSLLLSGERRSEQSPGNVRYHRRERESGTFSRALNLPCEIDPDKVEARLVDGILTVVVPKSAAARPRQITIK